MKRFESRVFLTSLFVVLSGIFFMSHAALAEAFTAQAKPANKSAQAEVLIERAQCVASMIPWYDPSMPRVIQGSLTVGGLAEQKAKDILGDKAAEMSSRRGRFNELIMVYTRRLSVDTRNDETYPKSGCLRQAVLSEQCELDHATQSLKCGEICNYKLECVDPRI